MRQAVAQGLLHCLAHIRGNVEGRVTQFEPQHFSSLCLLVEQAVTHWTIAPNETESRM